MSGGAASAAAAAGTGELAGRAVLVTGASSGIGRAIVAACGRAGAGVLAVGRDEGRLEETKQLFDAGRADDGGSCVTLSADVCADGASERIVAAAIEELGGLDVVIPAAGVFAPEPFLETSLESLDRQYEVNVRAPFALLQAAMPELARRGGTAVLVSSVAGVVGFPASTGYCATKGAVELLSKALALEFAPAGVRINSVAPGNVRTSMNAHLFADPEYERQMLASTPAGRIGEPEDIASAVVFLASSRADYMHGATLLVDGGWTAG